MKKSTDALIAIRRIMLNLPNDLGSIKAYIIPSDDAHQSEYLADTDQRRDFISGFNGSAGTAVITDKLALLWTDGRYWLQASQQLDENWTLMKDTLSTTPTIDTWLAKNVSNGDRVGVDANLLSMNVWKQLETSLKQCGSNLVPIEPNLVDLVWENKPPAPTNKVFPLNVNYAGKTVNQKLKEIRDNMKDNECSVLVVTALDEVAWLFNLRGSDIDYNPVFFSYAIVTMEETMLFIDNIKIDDNVNKHFEENDVQVLIRPYEKMKQALTELAAKSDGKVWISSNSSYALNALIPHEKRFTDITPICIMKSIKNEVEADGIKQCHIRDGLALCQYFSWLENQVESGNHVDEISGATQLEEFRKKQDKYMGLSFATISSSGSNGSIIHYHPEPETNRAITNKELYLCDSGAQYLDGTTDVTRTLHFGTPTMFEKECFTRVLKGQIALGTAIFPDKTKGQFLDTIARKSLWDNGLNYAHGTGHGIGHFLNVHEGPMYIGIRPAPDDPGLQENMFVSNEPGYYEDGEFGIRIEDIVQVIKADVGKNFNGRGALTFRTMTMCPIQTKMVDVKLLTAEERCSLNTYHKLVFENLKPILEKMGDKLTLDWLTRETQAI